MGWKSREGFGGWSGCQQIEAKKKSKLHVGQHLLSSRQRADAETLYLFSSLLIPKNLRWSPVSAAMWPHNASCHIGHSHSKTAPSWHCTLRCVRTAPAWCAHLPCWRNAEESHLSWLKIPLHIYVFMCMSQCTFSTSSPPVSPGLHSPNKKL